MRSLSYVDSAAAGSRHGYGATGPHLDLRLGDGEHGGCERELHHCLRRGWGCVVIYNV